MEGGSVDSVLRLADIQKTYGVGEEAVHAVRGVTLELLAGEFAALMGPSGSGKSTLLNICGLMDRPSAGECWLEGRACSTLEEEHLTPIRREKIGFIFQNFNLVPVLSVFENVEYPLVLEKLESKERRRRVQAMLESVGVARFAHHLPDRISGGQRQRVAIARALVKRPRLVIADEPTANLDTETATQVIDLMHRLAQQEGSSFLIATHDDRMASRCHRIFRMKDGVLCG